MRGQQTVILRKALIEKENGLFFIELEVYDCTEKLLQILRVGSLDLGGLLMGGEKSARGALEIK